MPSTIISADSGANRNKSINFLAISKDLFRSRVNLKKDYPTRLFLKIVATSLDDEEFDLIPFKV